jgi:pilus assembly protein CpaC
MTARMASRITRGVFISFVICLALAGGQRGAMAAADIVQTSPQHIALEVREGTLIRLDHPASNVFIADPDIADVQIKSPTLIYVFGKAPGETSLYAIGNDDKVLFNGLVAVGHDVTRLKEALHLLLPDSDIKATSFDGSVILSGHVPSPKAAEDARRIASKFIGKDELVMNYLEIDQPNQVNLRVRVAEISREVVKQLGFNWDSIVQGSDYAIGFATGAKVFQDVANPNGPGLIRQFFTRNNGTNSLVGSFHSGHFDLNSVVDALETQGLVSILAEPNLTALSGQSASFLAGGEFPVPVPQRSSDTITIAFKQFGVGLAFTPTILSDDRINLKILPEVSQLTTAGSVQLAGFNIPGLTTRRAQTTVELGSGESFAIAGLLQNNITQDISRLPGFGDIPILGALFRSDAFRRNETELVFIVTPYVVRPTDSNKMMTPVQGMKTPNDLERIIGGKTYHPQAQDVAPAAPTAQGRRLIGPAGFVLN